MQGACAVASQAAPRRCPSWSSCRRAKDTSNKVREATEHELGHCGSLPMALVAFDPKTETQMLIFLVVNAHVVAGFFHVVVCWDWLE